MLYLFAAAALAAPCQQTEQTTFEFHGQPECVALSFEGNTTMLTNACSEPLLVDQSVLLPSTGAGPLVPARTSTEIRDLNVFTLGLGGRIYRVVAVVAEPVCDSVEG